MIIKTWKEDTEVDELIFRTAVKFIAWFIYDERSRLNECQAFAMRELWMEGMNKAIDAFGQTAKRYVDATEVAPETATEVAKPVLLKLIDGGREDSDD
jgi:hypothetical protein